MSTELKKGMARNMANMSALSKQSTQHNTTFGVMSANQWNNVGPRSQSQMGIQNIKDQKYNTITSEN